MSTTKTPRKRGLKTGFTTGACTAAAAKAATRCLVRGEILSEVLTTLPNRQQTIFRLKRCEIVEQRAICSVIKDGGDDPDCTHGAEIIVEARLRNDPGIELHGGPGIAMVTKPGLGLVVGTAAINPVPQRNIRAMVQEELEHSTWRGATLKVSVPGGEVMAQKTINARLGLIGGISILGTTGIVKPYSTAAYRASVVQSIDVAHAHKISQVALTTGGRSESYAMAMYPLWSESAFIQMGDFIGTALKRCARHLIAVTIVAMVGKLAKIAAGKMQTHAAGSRVDVHLLAELAQKGGASQSLCNAIRSANTARHVQELCQSDQFTGLFVALARRVHQVCRSFVEERIFVRIHVVDFGGAELAVFPERNGT